MDGYSWTVSDAQWDLTDYFWRLSMTRLIDADALIESMTKFSNATGEDMTHGIFYAHIAPTIEAEPHWIPCSERLPENMELVNVTWVNRDPEPYYMHIKDKPFTATGIYYKGKWYWWSSTCADMLYEYGENEIDEVADGVDIVAWMPLPKPYEVKE